MKSYLPSQVSEKTTALVLFIVVLALPFVLSFNPYYLSIFISALILGSVCLAWNLLAGVCGQVSFGHAAFFGIGAYASALLVMKARVKRCPVNARAGRRLGQLAGAGPGWRRDDGPGSPWR